MLNRERLESALQALGQLLLERGLRYEVVAIGGSGLLLLGAITRSTKDIDLLAVADGSYRSSRHLPEPLREAIADVGRLFDLSETWMNAGPTDLLQLGLPPGFKDRVWTRTYGGLTLHVAARFDQICFKLYAAADHDPRSKHAQDLEALGATERRASRGSEMGTVARSLRGLSPVTERGTPTLWTPGLT
jgi:hypothetical protein